IRLRYETDRNQESFRSRIAGKTRTDSESVHGYENDTRHFTNPKPASNSYHAQDSSPSGYRADKKSATIILQTDGKKKFKKRANWDRYLKQDGQVYRGIRNPQSKTPVVR